MLITASTVLDTPENVRRFVAGNLAMGVDHLVVFLDDPAAPGQDEVAADLEAHPHVTCVRTDDAWWRGRRPRQLNVRQRIHANLTLALVEPLPEVAWVVHLDGDEVAAVDRDALAAVPADADAIWLPPLEAVSRFHVAEPPVLFKPLLGEDDLVLLHVLGVVPAPTNQAYFHGHVLGKSGVRPRSGLRLTLHDPVDAAGRRVAREQRHTAPGMRVLHYDAVSGEEFVRKWRAMVAAGPLALRADREPMVRALRTLVAKDLAPGVVETHLRRVYERTTEDDVATLHDLGLLERVDPREGRHSPAALSASSRERLAARLEELRHAPKHPFHVNHGGGERGPAGTGHAETSADAGASSQAGVLGRLRGRLPGSRAGGSGA